MMYSLFMTHSQEFFFSLLSPLIELVEAIEAKNWFHLLPLLCERREREKEHL